MSPHQKPAAARSRAPASAKAWSRLTWDDLGAWVGEACLSRGKAYQRDGRVKKLSLAKDGRLLAIVEGGERYVTSAWIASSQGKPIRLESTCTCPVGGGCKHAVAVVADFLAALAEKREVPEARPDDRQWAKIAGAADVLDDFDDEDAEDLARSFSGADECEPKNRSGGHSRKKPTQRSRTAARARRTRPKCDQVIRDYVHAKSLDELAGLIDNLIERFPEVRQEFRERIALEAGDVGRLLKETRRAMRAVTGEAGWQNYWNGEGYTPDYSRLKGRLEKLVELGKADEVVELGRELIARGMEQVGQSDDEGETGSQLADCLDVVFGAVAQSGLAPVDRVLYAIDACLNDDYDLLGPQVAELLDAKMSKDDWSLVADRLAARLAATPEKTSQLDFSSNYRRDQISDFLADALEHAGRRDELLSFYEREARATNSYQRLVSYLIKQKKFNEAQDWAREGIQKTHATLPGIASGLAQSMCDVAVKQKQWAIVAAHAAHRFFDFPSPSGFKELVTAAKKAGCEDEVRAAAEKFLETGVSPVRMSGSGKGGGKVVMDASWPLPLPDYLSHLAPRFERPHAAQPRFDVLLEMAILDKSPGDVLYWYERIVGMKKSRTGEMVQYYWHVDRNRVAKAVASAFPERALEIYRQELDAQLPHTGTSAYENCVACLRDMQKIFKTLDRGDYWDELVADIKYKYRNRPRFMEMLGRLDSRTIVETFKLPSTHGKLT